MNKTNSTVNLIMALAFFLALAMIAVFGIPFLQVPALFQKDGLNLSSDFRDGFEVIATVSESDSETTEDATASSIEAAEAVLPTIQKRAAALKYDVKVVDLKDGTLSLRFPADAQADAESLAKQITAKAVLSFVDSNGESILPAQAIAEATPGYGSLSESSEEMSYYLSFRVKDEYVEELAAATQKLSELSDGTSTANAANVMHIQLDGTDILAATVNESMTGGSFTISGSFEDETTPILYAALINNGAIDYPVTTGELNEFAAPLSESAFTYVWLGFAALILLLTVVAFFLYRASAIPYLFTNAFYFFFAGFCFQIFGSRFSVNSLIGLLIGFIVLGLVLCNFYRKMKAELSGGKPARIAFARGMKKATPFYLVVTIIILILSTALWVVSTLLGWSATNLAVIYEASATLFAASLFILVFAYWSTNFWYKLLLGYGVGAFGAQKDNSIQE